jgi:tetratricopeptide (TPR) repeat protein
MSAVRFGDHVTIGSQAGRVPRADPQTHVTWPIAAGAVPQLAVGHIDRPETAPGLPDRLSRGETVVLTDVDDAATRGAGGLGGTGKTQLAVAAAHALREAQAVDLLAWVQAGSRAAILTSYAHAAGQVGATRGHQDAESAARQLLDWLAKTSRPWLVVLDGLADPKDLDGLWPRGPAGRTLVTTRQHDASLGQAGRRIEHVGVFTRREAFTYLMARVDHDQRLEALDLVDDLGYLPLGLGLAAAVIASDGLSCREYRVRLSKRKAQLAGLGAQGYPAIITASWRLALESAEQLPPVRMARPALTLSALLGSDGIPGAVLTSKPACGFIIGRANAGGADDESQARRTLLNLASLGLVTLDGNDTARTVRVHSLVRAAVMDSLSAEEIGQAATAAASSLLEVWPEHDQAEPLLAQALRDCASSLQAGTDALLWDPELHPLLIRVGESLDAARLAGPAAGYWREMAGKSADVLGPGHLRTLWARDKLASALLAAGMFDDAIEVSRRTLAERERVCGPSHLDSLASRLFLAAAYQAAGRLADAIPVYEKSVAEQAWLLGPAHPDTWTPRASLARAYQAAGRSRDAIPLYQQIVADGEHVLEPGHPDLLAARRGLADSYQAAGLSREAIRVHERVVIEAERSGGADHPDTLAARASLATALLYAGRGKDAIRHSRRNLADRERVLGPRHRDTLTARASLADAHLLTGQVKEAIVLYERTLAEREKSVGPGDPDTVTSRASLASAYHSAGRLADAIPLYKRAIADSELIRGASHPDTITLRGNLAHAYHTAGRPADATALLDRTLADCERFLGPDHPLTQTMRENYDTITSE